MKARMTKLLASHRWSLSAGLAVAGTVAQAQAPATPVPVPTPRDVTVSVDFGASRGPLLHAERVNNLYPGDQYKDQLVSDVARRLCSSR